MPIQGSPFRLVFSYALVCSNAARELSRIGAQHLLEAGGRRVVTRGARRGSRLVHFVDAPDGGLSLVVLAWREPRDVHSNTPTVRPS